MSAEYPGLEKYLDVLTPGEVAEYLNLSKDTVRKLCSTGKLKHVRVGRLYKIPKQDIINFLENKA